MPSSGPMWHCYECNAEMRPLMMPDPHCASCSSTFVEMIDNETDDPRNFQVDPRHMHEDDEPFAPSPFGPGVDLDRRQDAFRSLMMGIGGPQRRASTIRIDRRTSPNSIERNTTISFGGGGGGPMMLGTVPPPGGFFISTSGPGGNIDMVPMLNTLFAGAGPPHSPSAEGQGEGQQPSHPLHQIFLNLLGAPTGDHNGQFGDYAYTSEALDRIMTQLMEQANGDKPVPAPDDMIARLPRVQVARGSSLLQKDCAVCKDEFEVSQETIELPCKHVFHDECILPWIKQSGTCPVCRHELVPQPKHASGAAGGGNPGQSSGNGGGSRSGNGTSGGGLGGGLFAAPRSPTGHSNNDGGSSSRSQSPGGRRHIPGGWHDLD